MTTDLTRISKRIRHHQQAAQQLKAQRHFLIIEALRAGRTQADISRDTGLTRARIAQLTAEYRASQTQ